MEKTRYLRLRRLGIDTHREPVVFMRLDCAVCKSEGLQPLSQVRVILGEHAIIASLNMVTSDILRPNEVGLSESAWQLLGGREGELVSFAHPQPLQSLKHVRRKIYGHELNAIQIDEIIKDITARSYSDIYISAFLASCAGGHLNRDEIIALTGSMVAHGDKLKWDNDLVVDKHCVGGLPGNRTSLIVVPIVCAYGLTMPKTSSRAITSPAGTADTMEVIAPVTLSLTKMRSVVEQEGGCIVWGGSVSLSPADDQMIQIERALNLDSEGQLVASILSKKIAAGSTHTLIDIPVGVTAKIRDHRMARVLQQYLIEVGAALGMHVHTVITDGSQPIGRGVGPALEAKDVLEVLQNFHHAPQDLRERALLLAGEVLEFSSKVVKGQGYHIAKDILDSGKAWAKFQAICDAQGGMSLPGESLFKYVIVANKTGVITEIDNGLIARLARLAGAPESKTAGIELHAKLKDQVDKGQHLFTIHAESSGALDYALDLYKIEREAMTIEEVEK